MKTALVCVLAGALIPLTSSCRTAGDGTVNKPHSKNAGGQMMKRDELCKALNEHWKQGNPYFLECQCRFRGPFTPAQVETLWIELRRRATEANGMMNGQTEESKDMTTDEAWSKLKAKYRDGDEIYYYLATAKNSKGQTAGYVLFRGNTVLDEIMTYMN